MRYLLIVIVLFSPHTWANAPFTQHLHHTAQAMSALYMYELSDADPQYSATFEQHISAAGKTLNSSSKIEKALFYQRWLAFSPHWQFNTTKKFHGLYLDVVVRNNARRYLTDIFLRVLTLPPNSDMSTQKIQEAVLFSSVLSARSLDLISAHEGSTVLSEYDKQIKERGLAQTVHNNINYLLSQTESKHQRNSLLKARSQFDFISHYIVNYDHKAPYFLMYKSVITMSRLLDTVS